MPLHPFVANMIEQARLAGRPGFAAGTPADARALLASSRVALGTGPAVAEVMDIAVPAPHGSIPARLFRPDGSKGLIVYLHGGGWVVGGLDDFDATARMLAVDSGAAVLLLDYRLAPEHPFPAGLDDACTALRYAATNLADLAPGASGVVIAGDSAGGNLAGVAALDCTDVALLGQVLIYPICDSDFSRSSYDEHGVGLPLGRADMEWFFTNYVGADPARRGDPRISFLHRSDLGKAPATFVLTAEFDLLRDECEELAAALGKAGVEVTLQRVEGLAHGFIRLGNVLPPARDAIRTVATFAAELFERAAAS